MGLAGELRSVHRIESRLKEAIHMGFKKALIPKRNLKGIAKELHEKIKICGIDVVEDAIDIALH